MHDWTVEYLSPKGLVITEPMRGDNPDDCCHQLTQRYGDEWKLLGCHPKGEKK